MYELVGPSLQAIIHIISNLPNSIHNEHCDRSFDKCFETALCFILAMRLGG